MNGRQRSSHHCAVYDGYKWVNTTQVQKFVKALSKDQLALASKVGVGRSVFNRACFNETTIGKLYLRSL